MTDRAFTRREATASLFLTCVHVIGNEIAKTTTTWRDALLLTDRDGLCQMNCRHLTAIISVSTSSIAPALINTRACLLVATTGVSPSNATSFAKCVFGAGKWTNPPSSSNNRSCHGISCWFHRKSFREMIAAFSAPSQANVLVAGFENTS